ncbi:MAG: 3'-5' exoribonuclease [Acidobacteriota bacterium]
MKKPRFWFDTEFLENGPGPIHLLSIGIVADDGREYYAVNRDCPISEANAWVKENVLPLIDIATGKPRAQIREEVLDFIGRKETPEIWAYCGAYDWVVLCQLIGTMEQLPKSWPHSCNDVRQWADTNAAAKLPPELPGVRHHALWDARWCRIAWDYLDMFERGRRAR